MKIKTMKLFKENKQYMYDLTVKKNFFIKKQKSTTTKEGIDKFDILKLITSVQTT